MQKNTKLLTLLLIAIGLISACNNNPTTPGIGGGQAENSNVNSPVNAQSTVVNENKPAENKATSTANVNKPTDEMPKIQKRRRV
ncbi:MAG: hypothetical protein HC846_03110 [Blastocatellia bacterium]|nr:hypothetical protein [Blastocatellia bacterium]